MDKLQPLLAHRFWIVLGLTICLALGAWYTGTGALAEQIATDQAAVDRIAIPETVEAPNPSWKERAEELRLKQEADLKAAARRLAGTQEELRTWPEGFRPYVAGVEYFGPITRQGREQYRFAYEPQLEELRRSLRPYDFETQTGVVNVPDGVLPRFDTSDWQSIPPESPTVWSAQEDVWLMRELLRQIGEVNEGAESILKAPVKEIQEFVLRGGAEVTADPEAEAAPAEGGDEEGGLRPIAPARRAAGPDDYFQDLDVTLDPEIGPADGVDQDPALIPPGMAAATEDGAAADDGEGGFADLGAPGGAQAEYVSPGGGRRYIVSDPAVPYRTRAFQLRLALDHREIPNMLAQLSNCAWPVEIVRVHYVEGVKPTGPTASGGGTRGGRTRGFRDDDAPRTPFGGGVGIGARRPPGFGPGVRPPTLGGPTAPTRPGPDASDPYQVAMSDPYLATVVIGGVMTIYKPRPEAELPDEPADPAAAGDFADPLNPAAPDPAAADPAAADPGLDPAAAGEAEATSPLDPAAAGEEAEDAGFGPAGGTGGGDFDLNATPPPPGAGAEDPAADDAPPGAAPEAIPADAEPVAEGVG